MDWYDPTGYLDFPFDVIDVNQMAEEQEREYREERYDKYGRMIAKGKKALGLLKSVLDGMNDSLDKAQTDCLDSFMEEECEGKCSTCKLREQIDFWRESQKYISSELNDEKKWLDKLYGYEKDEDDDECPQN